MITRYEVAEVCRYNDAELEELGGDTEAWTAYWISRRVDPVELAYVAEQRGLRGVMLVGGQDPRALSRSEPTPVQVSAEQRAVIPVYGVMFMDGFAAGLALGRRGL